MDSIKSTCEQKLLCGSEEWSVVGTELSIAQLERIDRAALTAATFAWRGRLQELTTGLPASERQAILIAAAATPPNLQVDKQAWIISNAGVKLALELSVPGMDKKWDKVVAEQSNAEAILELWRNAMGIKESKEATEAEASPNSPAA